VSHKTRIVEPARSRPWTRPDEYVEAMARTLRQPAADDYIVATGQSHTLTQFAETAFALIGKNWQDFVLKDQRLTRPNDISKNKVNPSKALQSLGWKAKNGMKDVIRMMLDAEMNHASAAHSTYE